MRVVGLRGVAKYLGVNHGTARKYSSGRYVNFPEPVVAEGPGKPSEWESDDLDAFQATRPGKGGGQHHKKFLEKQRNP